jgi:hypothetical protein
VRICRLTGSIPRLITMEKRKTQNQILSVGVARKLPPEYGVLPNHIPT